QRRYVGRRRRRWGAEYVLEQPLASKDRRGAVRVRRHREESRLAQQPLPRVVGQADSSEVIAIHVRDAVVASQPLVHKRIVRGEELWNGAVVANLTVEKQLNFAFERLTEVFVKLREHHRI